MDFVNEMSYSNPMVSPWISEPLAAAKTAELVRHAAEQRVAAEARAARAPASSRRRGAVARRLGQMLVSAGYRLAGTDALPSLAISGRRSSV